MRRAILETIAALVLASPAVGEESPTMASEEEVEMTPTEEMLWGIHEKMGAFCKTLADAQF